MSYYVQYDIAYHSTQKIDHTEYVKKLEEIDSSLDDVFGNFAYLEDICSEGLISWRNYEENMLELSKVFPDTLFIVKCTGEDGEFWKDYFYRGEQEYHEGVISYRNDDGGDNLVNRLNKGNGKQAERKL